MLVFRWLCVLAIAFMAGKLMTKIKMPAILGWLIMGMILGPNAVKLMPRAVMDAQWYKLMITWMQCAFGLMLGMTGSCALALLISIISSVSVVSG